jgi:tetratricopeptide (TPR) repeat protein
LEDLEKEALGVESQLSVLKRRRALAREDPRFRGAYAEAAYRAAELFPLSEPLAAVAAEALVQSGQDIDPEKARAYAARISSPAMTPLALSLLSLSGALGDPARAAAVPRLPELLPAIAPALPEAAREGLLTNTAILHILRGDIPAAAALIRTLLPTALAAETLRFAAEFFYDFGDPLRAAELFSRFPDEAGTARQADALRLAGRLDSARALWTTLSSPGNGSAVSPALRTRSLYNLAATAADLREELPYLERLLVISPEDVYGVIRYTRLLESPRAIAILEGSPLLRREPLLDLELLRRREDRLPVSRIIPETWLLIERHPAETPLYEWGCYYFDWQRQYGETRVLIRNAGHRGIGSPRLTLHEGLALIREGRLDAAEELLKAVPPEEAVWQIPANIARLLEAKRSTAAALEYYEIASSKVDGGPNAALIQLRIARCLNALGRERESRRVLEYALSLDPDNLNARLELRRLDALGIF